MTFTNSSTVEDACRVIEVAYMTGCLMMPCFYDQFRKGLDDSSPRSVFHGVPLVQSAKLFESVRLNDAGGLLTDPSGRYYQFTPSFKLLDENDKVIRLVLINISMICFLTTRCVSFCLVTLL
jgi:hypothetical protein